MISSRPATPSDLDTVVRLTRAAYAVYLPVLGYSPLPVDEDYSPRIAHGEVFLFDEAAGTVGLAVVERHVDHMMLFSIAVAPEYQGKGYAIAILNWLKTYAVREGRREIRLYTNALMSRNIGLYQRFGFVETGRRPNPKRPQFTVVDMAMAVS